MLRVAVPYGELSSQAAARAGRIAREYDARRRPLRRPPAATATSPPARTCSSTGSPWHARRRDGPAGHGRHARHPDQRQLHPQHHQRLLAGIAADEIVDPRPYCEILRQWSTLHPEFAFLPRKFKIAVTGAVEDRAATGWHDIGLQLVKNEAGEIGFRVLVGGGMGRTPIIGTVIREFLPWQQILVFIEAIVRVYNRYGRRDNMYKARIKILVKAEGQKFIDAVEAEFAEILERDVDGGRAPHHRRPSWTACRASFAPARRRDAAQPPARRPAPAPRRRAARPTSAGWSATCTRTACPATAP